MSAAQIEQAKAGIVHHARECEDHLRLAAFADSEPSYTSGMGAALRKMAAIHSEDAFRWARRLQATPTSAVRA